MRNLELYLLTHNLYVWEAGKQFHLFKYMLQLGNHAAFLEILLSRFSCSSSSWLVGWFVWFWVFCVCFFWFGCFFLGGGGVLLLLLLGGGGSGVLGFCLFVFVLVCFTCGLSLHVETLKKTLNCNVSKLTFWFLSSFHKRNSPLLVYSLNKTMVLQLY